MDRSSELLEIYILTYNRKKYLEECLNSVLAQTDKHSIITVIDNKSTDGTKELLEKYRSKGINSIINEKNLGGIGSIRKAQKLSTGKWIMIFHDDDMLHPQFVEQARKYFDLSEVVLITSYGKKTLIPENVWLQEFKGKVPFETMNSSEFTGTLIKAKLIPFCSAVYRGKYFREVEFKEDIYGKVGDRPFLLDVAEYGDTVLLKEELVLTRVHQYNDSRATDRSLNSSQWISLVQRIRRETKKQKWGMGNISFMVRGRKYLMMPLEPQIIREDTRTNYLEKAYRANAISKMEMVIGMPYHYLYLLLRTINRFVINARLKRVGKS